MPERKISGQTRTRALKVLDGIEQFTHNDMLEFGHYVSPGIVRHDLAQAGAVCGGRKACLIGSAYIAGGVKLKTEVWGAQLPGVVRGQERAEFLRHRHGLRIAIDALNEAAMPAFNRLPKHQRDYIASGRGADYGESIAEGMFEEGPWGHGNRDTVNKRVLRLVGDARKIVKEMA